uniref:Uncharacterized protein n=1 Tax=Anguilla anguilla TaxID=7936 RepID=A0A0E9SCB6_ANGAN
MNIFTDAFSLVMFLFLPLCPSLSIRIITIRIHTLSIKYA